MEFPESAYWDKKSGFWYVSNLGGTEFDAVSRDGNGFIARISADGTTVQRWITGLNAPKGIRTEGNTMYVSDVDEVVKIDVRGRRVLARVVGPGSRFLNDVAIDDRTGAVYVSDMFADAVYRISNERAELFVHDAALEAPNGLLVDGGTLYVATRGPDFDPATFATSAPAG